MLFCVEHAVLHALSCLEELSCLALATLRRPMKPDGDGVNEKMCAHHLATNRVVIGAVAFAIVHRHHTLRHWEDIGRGDLKALGLLEEWAPSIDPRTAMNSTS